MSKKITWHTIHKEFKKNFPKLYKRVTYWHPHDYATIELYLDDGMKAIYNFDLKKVTFLDERWIKER